MMAEEIELEALAALAEWYERYSPYMLRLRRFARVFEVLDSLGIGRLLLRPGQWMIYFLSDPDTGLVCYVGITSNPIQRLQDHMKLGGSNPAKQEWIQRLKMRRMYPAMHKIEVVQGKEAAEAREAQWVEVMERLGYNLLNELPRPGARR